MLSHLRNAFLILLFTGVFVGHGWAEAVASEPASESFELQEGLQVILSQPEFQPRGSTLTAWDRLKQNVKHWIGERISELWKSIPRDLIKIDSTSAFGRFLMGIADIAIAIVEFLAPLLAYWVEIIVCLGMLVLLYFAIPLISKRVRRGKVVETPRPTRTQRRVRTLEEIQELGLTRPALAAFRELLRSELEKKYSVAFSTTDREMCKKLPANETNLDLFKSTAGLFEIVEFAGSPLAPERFSELLKVYQAARGSEQS